MGGVLLTSRYTLDAQNPAARRELAQLGDLVFALRLPEGAHRRAAGTDAVTDLVVFRRRGPGEAPAGDVFERAVRTPLASGEGAVVNEYFVAHPDNVLGELYLGRGMYGDDELSVRAQGDVAAAFAVAIEREATAAATRGKAPGRWRPLPHRAHCPGAPLRAARRAHDRRCRRRVRPGRERALLPHPVPRTQAAELRALCGLRDAAKALLEAEAATRDDTQAIAGLRAELNRRYDAYVAAYGPVNRCSFREVGRPDEAGERRLAQFRPPRGGFAKDPFAGVVDALEIFDPETQHARKAPLLSRRVIAPAPARLGADTPEDALAICLDERAKVDLPKWPASSVSSGRSPRAARPAGVRRPRLGPAPACGRVPLRERPREARRRPGIGARRPRATSATSRRSKRSFQPLSAQLRSAPAWVRPGST